MLGFLFSVIISASALAMDTPGGGGGSSKPTACSSIFEKGWVSGLVTQASTQGSGYQGRRLLVLRFPNNGQSFDRLVREVTRYFSFYSWRTYQPNAQSQRYIDFVVSASASNIDYLSSVVRVFQGGLFFWEESDPYWNAIRADQTPLNYISNAGTVGPAVAQLVRNFRPGNPTVLEIQARWSSTDLQNELHNNGLIYIQTGSAYQVTIFDRRDLVAVDQIFGKNMISQIRTKFWVVPQEYNATPLPMPQTQPDQPTPQTFYQKVEAILSEYGYAMTGMNQDGRDIMADVIEERGARTPPNEIQIDGAWYNLEINIIGNQG